VARGTQHRKRRPAANARAAQAVAAKPKPKVKHPSWEDQLFFNRLRRHAKWVYLTLALAFAGTFIFLGVGSGSTGLGDILQNAFQRNSSSGGSVGSLQKKVAEHPGDATAWHDLATKLQQDQRTDEAIAALKHYTALRPRDTAGLDELAALYSQRIDDYQQQASDASANAQVLAPGGEFQPAPSTTFGKLFSDPTALQDPIANAVTTQANGAVSDAYTKLTDVSKQSVAIYKRLATLEPSNAVRQVQLGQAAATAGDTATAIAAFQKFLKLAPNDVLAPQVKQELKQLRSSAASG
jgi:cytochrome c-type biogenesis protein CcmH/NrfG